MNKISFVVLFVALFISINLYGADAMFFSDTVINDGETYDTVWVKNTLPGITKLTVNGGNIDLLSIRDNCIVEINGGTIGLIYVGRITLQPTVEITGGMINDLNLWTGKVLITGGQINSLHANNVVNPQAYILNLSVLHITGGQFNTLDISDSCNANIYGSNFNYDSSTGELKGTWKDGMNFSIADPNPGFYMSGLKFHDASEPVCLDELESDITHDCKVNLDDLAKLASDWLKCNLDPQSNCYN